LEGSNIFEKNRVTAAHLPTVMILIGYLVFWLELFCFDTQRGITSALATTVFGLYLIVFLMRNYQSHADNLRELFDKFVSLNAINKCLVTVSFLIILFIIGVTLKVALLAPHLLQEYDSINYHMTIPRQHLILGSFSHIPWSTADLFPLPLDFALAPYWFLTSLPNKIPQFIIALGLVGVCVQLVKWLTNDSYMAQWLTVMCVLGSHIVGIQLGTAMLDLMIAYLFFACLDSYLRGNIFLAAVEFTFFFWSKAFVPPQTLCLVILIYLLALALKKWMNFKLQFGLVEDSQGEKEYSNTKNTSRFLILIVLFSVVVGGPFVAKSLYYSGSPLYPFGFGLLEAKIQKDESHWASLTGATNEHMRTRNYYGHGRDVVSFVKHFWLIAVPEKGVNNAFDYPLGLPFLLMVGPFLFLYGQRIVKKRFSICGTYLVLNWLSWWFGSQQSRFLYIPLILMFILKKLLILQFKKVNLLIK